MYTLIDHYDKYFEMKYYTKIYMVSQKISELLHTK